MSRHTRLITALGFGLVACSSRPLDTAIDTDASSSAPASSSSSASAATTDGTSGEPTSTAGTDGSTSGSTSASTSGTSTSASTSGTSTAGSTSTSGGPPAACGPPCDETWEIDGDLDVVPWGDPPLLFHCLTAVHGQVRIQPDVPEDILASLGNLRQVDNGLSFEGHEQVTDVDFLGCLEEVGWLDLAFAPKLTDLSGLSSLRVAPSVYLRGLPITALPAFAPDFTGLSTLALADNPALVDLTAASTWGHNGDFFILLNFHNNAALTSLADLGGLLGALGDVSVNVQITDHPALTSLAGLESLTAIEQLWLSGLPKLADLAPLAGILDAGAITLNDIPELTSLAGLGSLVSAGDLTIGDCVNQGQGGLDGITSLAGLDSLSQIVNLALANNDALSSLDGAPKLTSVKLLTAVDNPKLTQASYDAFLAQLDKLPNADCIGPWAECQCFVLMPW